LEINRIHFTDRLTDSFCQFEDSYGVMRFGTASSLKECGAIAVTPTFLQMLEQSVH